MFRFSLRAMFVGISVFSIALTGLMNPSLVWSKLLFSTTVALLVWASLVAFIWRGQARDFAVGFAFTGWVYFASAFVAGNGLLNQLPTNALNGYLYDLLHNPRIKVAGAETFQVSPNEIRLYPRDLSSAIVVYKQDALRGGTWSGPSIIDFVEVAHLCWTLGFSLLGGLTATAIATRDRARAERTG